MAGILKKYKILYEYKEFLLMWLGFLIYEELILASNLQHMISTDDVLFVFTVNHVNMLGTHTRKYSPPPTYTPLL